MGSIMGTSVFNRPPGSCRPKEEVIIHAKDFFEQYFTSIKRYFERKKKTFLYHLTIFTVVMLSFINNIVVRESDKLDEFTYIIYDIENL